MLPNHNNVRDVVEGPNGIFKNTFKGSLILDCSTISPKAAIGFHESAKRAGHFYCDSPVSGGVGAAKAAKLTFMVGTDNKMVFERAKEFL